MSVTVFYSFYIFVIKISPSSLLQRTYIGDPIPYDPSVTCEELALKVRWFLFQ